LVFTTFCFGQTDTIYTFSDIIPCSVKEITPEAIKYTYPDEDVLISIYKNSVTKIVFKNGRVQTFAEALSLKEVRGADDFEKVSITRVEGEIKGLYRIGDVGAKAKGTTTLSNQQRVKERAYRKMKILAAMMGGNIVYLTDQRTQGNQFGTEYQAGNTAEANISGIAYATKLPNYNEFTRLIGDKKSFNSFVEVSMASSASDMTITGDARRLDILEIREEGGFIYLYGNLQYENSIKQFRIVSYNNESFTIFYVKRNTAYNYRIRF
jgi:hypothetical protein